MFCPMCGKTIADESIFCMFCGKGVLNEVVKPTLLSESSTRNTSPVAIDKLWWGTSGPTDVNRKFLKEEIGRGFYFEFSLMDEDGKQTSDSGKAIVALQAIPISVSAMHRPIYGNDIKMIDKAQKKSFFYREFDISAEQWDERNGCKVTHVSPLIYRNRRDLATICFNFWFRTSEGKLLYKVGDAINWR